MNGTRPSPASPAEQARFELLRLAVRWAANMSTRHDVVVGACETLFYYDSNTLAELAGLTGFEAIEPDTDFSEMLSEALRELDLPNYKSQEARVIVGRRIMEELAHELKDSELEQAVRLLTRHSPLLGAADTEYLLEDGREAPTLRMATLGSLLPALDDAVLPGLLNDVERLVVEGGKEVGEAICTGLLEAVTNAVERESSSRLERQIAVRRLRRFLGPESLRYLRAWDRFNGVRLWYDMPDAQGNRRSAQRLTERVVAWDLDVSWNRGAPEAVLISGDFGGAVLALNAHVDDPDQSCVVLTWRYCKWAARTPPNDEARPGHPLYAAGLNTLRWGGLVENSALIAELERMNSVHPRHDPSRFQALYHYVLPLKEGIVEIVGANDVGVHRDGQSTEEAALRQLRQGRSRGSRRWFNLPSRSLR